MTEARKEEYNSKPVLGLLVYTAISVWDSIANNLKYKIKSNQIKSLFVHYKNNAYKINDK